MPSQMMSDIMGHLENKLHWRNKRSNMICLFLSKRVILIISRDFPPR